MAQSEHGGGYAPALTANPLQWVIMMTNADHLLAGVVL
jgi:hypothetical protein